MNDEFLKNLLDPLNLYPLEKSEIYMELLGEQLPKNIDLFKKAILNKIKEERKLKKLTESELNEIVDSIPKMPAAMEEISIDMTNQIRNNFKEILSRYKFKSGKISEIKEIIERNFYQSLVEPGECLGSNVTQAVIQPLTQSNFNTFHQSGSLTATNPFESIQKLLRAGDNNINNTYIHLRKKNYTREETREISFFLLEKNVQTYISRYEILLKITENDKEWRKKYCNFLGIIKEKKGIFLRLHINIVKCIENNMTLNDICKIIKRDSSEEVYDFYISSMDVGIIDIYPNPLNLDKAFKAKCKEEIPFLKDSEKSMTFINTCLIPSFKMMIDKGVSNLSKVSIESINIFMNSIIEKLSEGVYKITVKKSFIKYDGVPFNHYIICLRELRISIKSENCPYIVVECNKSPMTIIMEKISQERDLLVKETLQIKKEIKEGKLPRLPNYSKFYRHVIYSYIIGESKRLKDNSKEHHILRSILKHNLVDSKFSISNNLIEIMSVFGIDVLLRYLFHAYLTAIESVGTINPINVEILSMYQTCRGIPIGISASGFSKTSGGPLTMASFQSPLDEMIKASSVGGKEHLKSSVSRVIIGQKPLNGTNVSEIKWTSVPEELSSDPEPIIIEDIFVSQTKVVSFPQKGILPNIVKFKTKFINFASLTVANKEIIFNSSDSSISESSESSSSSEEEETKQTKEIELNGY